MIVHDVIIQRPTASERATTHGTREFFLRVAAKRRRLRTIGITRDGGGGGRLRTARPLASVHHGHVPPHTPGAAQRLGAPVALVFGLLCRVNGRGVLSQVQPVRERPPAHVAREPSARAVESEQVVGEGVDVGERLGALGARVRLVVGASARHRRRHRRRRRFECRGRPIFRETDDETVATGRERRDGNDATRDDTRTHFSPTELPTLVVVASLSDHVTSIATRD